MDSGSRPFLGGSRRCRSDGFGDRPPCGKVPSSPRTPRNRANRAGAAGIVLVMLIALPSPCQGFFGTKRHQAGHKPSGQGRKVVFIFSKARSANSMTSKLFDLNPDFLHFLEPYSAWRERRAAERSLVADVDFLERLVDCKLASEEVYSVVTQGAAVPQGLRTQRLSSTVAAEQLSGLCANRHIAVKTVRQASLSAICELRRRLTRRGDELYVVDSYRDPRAVVASLLEAAPEALSAIPEPQRLKKMSESACQHMTARFSADERECKGLMKYSLQNEHFVQDPVTEGEKLYKFIGLKMPQEVKEDLSGAMEPDASVPTNTTGAAEDAGDRRAQPLEGKQLPQSKPWHEVITKQQGLEVQAVCQRIMPRELFRMVFVA